MDDDKDLDLDLGDDESAIINRKDKKIKSLSDKFEISEKEKADIIKAKEEAEAKATASTKDAEFYKGFNTISSKYEGASEYQDQIREKVLAGYDLEDATVAVLNKEGKFTPVPQVEQRQPIAAGGSASTSMNLGAEKAPNQYTRAELKSALMEAESKGEFKF